jgi:hypothetical protein
LNRLASFFAICLSSNRVRRSVDKRTKQCVELAGEESKFFLAWCSS